MSSFGNSLGFLAELNLSAEKLVEENASAIIYLEMANPKLKIAVDHIHLLEEKLQNALSENAKLQVKQKEAAKLWKGLESKFSSTKTLCYQLTETLQHLAGQVRDAEHDKKVCEDKLLASSKAFESLQLQMIGLTLKIDSTEENMRKCEESLSELKIEKEEREKFYINKLCRTANLIGEKDAQIKDLERAVAAQSVCLDNVNTRLEDVRREYEQYAARLLASGQRMKDLQGEESLSELKIEKEEREKFYINEQGRTANLIGEKDNKELKSKSTELQILVELLISQHAEEKHLVEMEAERLILKNTELEILCTIMEERTKQLSEEFEVAGNIKQELSQNISTLQGKAEENEALQKLIMEREEHVASLENQVSELRRNLEKKEQLKQQYMERGKSWKFGFLCFVVLLFLWRVSSSYGNGASTPPTPLT